MKTEAKFSHESETGSSLLAILIGFALLGIFVQVVSTYAVNSEKEARRIATSNALIDLENFIKVRTNCAKTKLRRASHPALLFDRKGAAIAEIKDGVMAIGHWRVKVSAYSNATGVFTLLAANRHANTPDFKPILRASPLVCP